MPHLLDVKGRDAVLYLEKVVNALVQLNDLAEAIVDTDYKSIGHQILEILEPLK